MKLSSKTFKLLSLLTILASGIYSPVATAEQGRIFKDSTGAVYIYGLSPSTAFEAGFDTPITRRIQSNSCGVAVVRNSNRYPETGPNGTISLDGAVITKTSLPTQIIPYCKNGVLEEPRTAPFKTVEGWIVVPGKAPNRVYSMVYPDTLEIRKRKANSCGFLQLSGTDALSGTALLNLPTTTGSNANFLLSTIPASKPPRCFKKKLYLPQDWAAPLATSVAVGGGTGGGTTGGGSTGGGSTGGGSTGSGNTGGGSTGGSSSTGGGSTGSGNTGGGSTGGSNTGNGTIMIGGLPETYWLSIRPKYKAKGEVVLQLSAAPGTLYEFHNSDVEDYRQFRTNSCGWGKFPIPSNWSSGTLYRDTGEEPAEVESFDINDLPDAGDYTPHCP